MTGALDDRAMAAVAADLLRQASSLHAASVALTLAAGLSMPVLAAFHLRPWPLVGVSAALLFGLTETWLALRVGFDRRIFERFAGMGGEPLAPSRFDRALAGLGLVPAPPADRSMGDRLRGCVRLMRLQAASFVLQLAALLVGGWMAVLA